MTPLVFATENKPLVIKEILGCDKIKKRLLENGFFIGERISFTKNGCNFIVKISESTKFVLGFGLANKILIDEE